MPAIIVDPQRSRGFTTVDQNAANGLFLDDESGILYYTDGTTTYQFDRNTASFDRYIWRSRLVPSRYPLNIGAAIVEADSYDNLTFRLFIRGTLKFTKTVTSGEPFRCPGGYLSNLIQIELEGTDRVQSLSIAEDIFELSGE